MKPADVTDEMVRAFTEVADYVYLDKEIIAAAVNAVLGDPTPITAEWLVKNGYVAGLHDPETYCKPIGDRTASVCNHGHVYLDFGILANTKTIGQLRALEIGLGIEPCQ